MVISNKKLKRLNVAFNIVLVLAFLAAVVIPVRFEKATFLCSVTFRAVSALYFLFYVWFIMQNNKTVLKIVISVLTSSLFVSCFFKTAKTVNVIDNLALVMLFVLLVLSIMKKRCIYFSSIVFTYFLIQASTYAEKIILFENKTVYIIAIIDAVLCTVLAVFIHKKKYADYTVKSTAVKLIILCVIFAVTNYTSFVIYKNMNYALNTSKPSTEQMIVEDKEVRYSKNLTDECYYLIVYYNDKTISLQVGKDDYEHYSPGDKYPLNVYTGILKQKYYLCVE